MNVRFGKKVDDGDYGKDWKFKMAERLPRSNLATARVDRSTNLSEPQGFPRKEKLHAKFVQRTFASLSEMTLGGVRVAF